MYKILGGAMILLSTLILIAGIFGYFYAESAFYNMTGRLVIATLFGAFVGLVSLAYQSA